MATVDVRALLACNGIDGASGSYLVPDLPAEDIARVALHERIDARDLADLRWRHRRDTQPSFALAEGHDPDVLDDAGWGVIFARDVDPLVREALSPLLDRRRAAAGDLYKELVYREGESKNDFLARYKHGPGPVDPKRVPYYLLIVGGPAEIPFRFQYLLDVQFAVGRVHFATPDDYARYAMSVLRSESAGAKGNKRAAFFGVRNAADAATQLSADALVTPLSEAIRRDMADWKVEAIVGAEAQKAKLGATVASAPQVLFSASHGMGFPNGDPRQLVHQGALLCQDWPGPLRHRGPISEDWYFSGDDVPQDADLTGVVMFMFACFGAGTPKMDEFSQQAFKKPEPIAPCDFVSMLPQKLLANRAGGALAVIGHVERAWGYSFAWPGAGPQLQVFESTLKRLMKGHPIGHALDYFNGRYAELATVLATMVEDAQFSRKCDDIELAGVWTALNDSRSYVVLGDPAVSLR